ncbi:hypothetical protein PPERSA_02704 [Pseudocohnilembus persalinus]|uniref:EF-hand domain-containing protein n=1 Tax=Pseudocohnilembus persalinus TaxID=266149 RepID=A0A0V0R6Q2_PSEPJ|nr:hypothetical protein PPERSA_02704 [Pseudocohnilembus persalinus]|eukprot:KRX09832.1 hypothetical protein PPERSA_02704 [Pseudocohnilembus persalinus]
MQTHVDRNTWAELAQKLPSKKNPEDYKKRTELFNLFDPNGNGYLSLAEVDKGIRDILRCDTLFDVKPVIMRAFQAAKNSVKTKSKYGDDYIERCEFRLLLVYLRQYFEYWVMFQRIDKNFDRRVSLEEFKQAVPEINKWGVTITNPEKSFQQIDKNGGGMILFDEFCQWAIKQSLDLEDDDD